MKRILFGVFMMSFLSACQIPYSLKTHNMNNEFNTEQAKKLVQAGKNNIIGNSFLKQRSGNVITCAGNEVSLIPATVYAEERMLYLYNSTENGINRIGWYDTPHSIEREYQFIPDNKEYHELIKKTTCDSSGHFKFNNVANGSFFIITHVFWESPGQYQMARNGGVLMQKVTVENGETKEVIITH